MEQSPFLETDTEHEF